MAPKGQCQGHRKTGSKEEVGAPCGRTAHAFAVVWRRRPAAQQQVVVQKPRAVSFILQGEQAKQENRQ